MPTQNNFIAAALSISNARHDTKLVAENTKEPTIIGGAILYNAITGNLLVIRGKKNF